MCFLTLLWLRSILNRIQFIDLLCKSMSSCLYDRDLRHERVKHLSLPHLRKRIPLIFIKAIVYPFERPCLIKKIIFVISFHWGRMPVICFCKLVCNMPFIFFGIIFFDITKRISSVFGYWFLVVFPLLKHRQFVWKMLILQFFDNVLRYCTGFF